MKLIKNIFNLILWAFGVRKEHEWIPTEEDFEAHRDDSNDLLESSEVLPIVNVQRKKKRVKKAVIVTESKYSLTADTMMKTKLSNSDIDKVLKASADQADRLLDRLKVDKNDS